MAEVNRQLVDALVRASGRDEASVEAWLDEPSRIARDVGRRSSELRVRAQRVFRQIREGEL